MLAKVCILAAISIVVNSTCPPPLYRYLIVNRNAEVITANDGVTLQGIRVSWTYNLSYMDCIQGRDYDHFQVNVGGRYNDPRMFFDITLQNTSADFLEGRNIDCNKEYTPGFLFVISGGSTSAFRVPRLFYGSSLKSAPSKLSGVIAELDTLDPRQRFSIYWDPLPCHLQNSASVSSYIIRYRLLSEIEPRTISTIDNNLLACSLEPLGPYRCYVSPALLFQNQIYSIQVAANNSFGIGPFSDPVTVTTPVYWQDTWDDQLNSTCTISLFTDSICASPYLANITGIAETSQLTNYFKNELLPHLYNITERAKISDTEGFSQLSHDLRVLTLVVGVFCVTTTILSGIMVTMLIAFTRSMCKRDEMNINENPAYAAVRPAGHGQTHT